MLVLWPFEDARPFKSRLKALKIRITLLSLPLKWRNNGDPVQMQLITMVVYRYNCEHLNRMK